MWATTTPHELGRLRRFSRSNWVLQEAVLGDSVAGMFIETVLLPAVSQDTESYCDWACCPLIETYHPGLPAVQTVLLQENGGTITRLLTQNFFANRRVTCRLNRLQSPFANLWPFALTVCYRFTPEVAVFHSSVNPKACSF